MLVQWVGIMCSFILLGIPDGSVEALVQASVSFKMRIILIYSVIHPLYSVLWYYYHSSLAGTETGAGWTEVSYQYPVQNGFNMPK